MTDGSITMQQFAEQTFCMKSDSDRGSGEHVLDLSTARGNISRRDDMLPLNVTEGDLTGSVPNTDRG